jgi:antiviral helicase SKI2
LPAIVFSFSKKKCETLAYSLSTVNLTSPTEKSHIHQFIEESLTRLKGTDKKLPQVQYVKDILKRGQKMI